MNYLVTGGSGFVGSHIVRLLAERGDEVVAYDVQPQKKKKPIRLKSIPKNQLNTLQAI